MTKEQFENQQWYKNMPVWANGQKCYVREVRFMTGEINVIYKIGATSGVTWNFCLVETSPPEPTALDLIAQEREKQISKGYTVEHDQKYNPTGRLPLIADDMINRRITKCPDNWNYKYWVSLCNRPYKDRVRICSYLVCKRTGSNYSRRKGGAAMSQITSIEQCSKCLCQEYPFIQPRSPGMTYQERISLLQRMDVLETRCMRLRHYCAGFIQVESLDFERADRLHEINYSEYKQIALKLGILYRI